MKPWREIAVPHNDVLRGTFQQSEFAADIKAVRYDCVDGIGSSRVGYLREATETKRNPRVGYTTAAHRELAGTQGRLFN